MTCSLERAVLALSAMRFLRVLPLVAILLLWPSSRTSADVCSAIMSVSPRTGPAGSTFTFVLNKVFADEALTLRIYHAGVEVKVLHTGNHTVTAAFTPTVPGHWSARAEVTGAPVCHTRLMHFVVLGEPDTATAVADSSSPVPALGVAWIAGSLVGAAMVFKVRRRQAP